MRLVAVTALSLVLAGGLLAVACGEDGDAGSASTPTPGVSPIGTFNSADAPLPEGSSISPPMEGAPRGLPATERTNYWALPEFALPAPGDLPELPATGTDSELHPSAGPQCPEAWQTVTRPGEGLSICYPADWRIEGHGYVSVGSDDRWYSLGLFLYKDGVELAHVSVYALNAYAQPINYTRDCEQAYRVAFAGEPAVLCPDFPGRWPEVRIISYHVRKDDLDYYVNVVPRYQADSQSGTYSDTWSEEAEATAIQIAHSFRLIRRVSP